MKKRVRLSTVVVAVVFAGLLALYVEVRPPPVSAAGDVTVETTTAPEPTRSRSPTYAPTGTAQPSSAERTVPDPSTEPTTQPTTQRTTQPTRDSRPRLTSTAPPTSVSSTGSP